MQNNAKGANLCSSIAFRETATLSAEQSLDLDLLDYATMLGHM